MDQSCRGISVLETKDLTKRARMAKAKVKTKTQRGNNPGAEVVHTLHTRILMPALNNKMMEQKLTVLQQMMMEPQP